MMNKILLPILFLLTVAISNTNAQLAIGSTAPNFTVTDINGQSHTLYDYLDQGMAVFVDFSATWCGPCWDYHQNHTLANIYDKYGPEGSGQVMVLFLEGSMSTGMSQLMGQGGGTYGNWIDGTPYPIIDLQSTNVLNDYQIGGFPSVFTICPDRKVVLNGAYNQSYLEFIMKQDCSETINPSIFSSTVGTTQETCPGKGDGGLEISLNGFFPPFDVFWNDGSNGTTLENIISGDYYATVRDAEGFTIEVGPINVTAMTDGVEGNVSEIVDADCIDGPGSISINVAEGTPPYEYYWNTGESTQNIDGLFPGDYYVTITDANGCRDFLQEIEVGGTNIPIVITADSVSLPCIGNTATLFGAESSNGPGYTTTWSTPNGNIISGENSVNATVNLPGEYTLTVSNTNDCTSTSTVIVSPPNTPEIIVAPVETINCENECVVLDASASASAPNIEVMWIPIFGEITSGETTLTPEVCSGGLYRLLLTNNDNFCGNSEVVSVDVDLTMPFATTESLSPLSCSSGSTILSGAGSTTGDDVTYRWTSLDGLILGDPTLLDIEISSPGTYTLKVTNTSSTCVGESTITVEPNDDIPEAIVATPDILDCINTNLTLDASASTSESTLSYEWTTLDGNIIADASTANPQINEAGTYLLTITNLSGCTDEATVVIEQAADLPEVSAIGNTITCENTTVTLESSSNMEVSYEWSGPNGFSSTEANPTVDQAGAYIITVTANNGCTSSTQVVVQADNNIPSVIATAGQLNCIDTQTELSATSNDPNVTYQWTGPIGFSSELQNPSVETSGIYTVIATADNGCTSSSAVIVESDNVIPSSLFENTSGNIAINCNNPTVSYIGFTDYDGDYELTWSAPDATNSNETEFTMTEGGTYLLMITAANGCESTSSVTVLEDFSQPSLEVVGGIITCVDNSIQLLANSSEVTASYEWSGPGITSANAQEQNPFVSTPGEYTLTVISALNGCASTESVIVEQDADIPIVEVLGGSLDCAISEITLESSTSGNINNYEWSGPHNFSSTDANPTINEAGIYTLVVTAENGCIATTSTEVTANTEGPEVTTIGGLLTCVENSITLQSETDDPEVTYEWSGPGITSSNAQDSNPEVSSAGEYTLTITADNGCTSSSSTIVEQDENIPVAEALGGNIDCTTSSIQIEALVSDPNVTIEWTGPNGFTSNEMNPTVSMSGIYILTATATNGCVATAETEVLENTALPMIDADGGLLTCAENSVVLQSIGSSTIQDYIWDGPGINSNNADDANPEVSVPGLYTLTAIGENGCQNTVSVEVLQDENIPTALASGGDLDCNTSSVELSAVSSAADVIYEWSGPNGFSSTESNPIVSESGIYILAVTADNGCIATSEVIVNDNSDSPEIEMEGGRIDCINTIVTLSATSSDENLSYEWSGPAINNDNINDANPSVDIAGIYLLTVTNEFGCESLTEVLVEENINFPIVEVSDAVISCNDNLAILETSVESSDITFEWTGPNGFSSTEENPTVDAAGIYNLSATGQNGCITEVMAIVESDDNGPEIELSNQQIPCTSTNVTLSASTSSNIEYTWQGPGITDDNANSATPDVDETGVYTLIATGENGCTTEASLQVFQEQGVSAELVGTINPTCAGGDNGSILMEVFTGTPPFNYNWSNGQSTSTASNLEAGEYQVTITDSNDCIAVVEAIVEAPENIELSTSSTDEGTYLGDNGSASVEASGGTPPFVYEWTDANTGEIVGDYFGMMDLSPGDYQVVVTDANGCDQMALIVIDEFVCTLAAEVITANTSCVDSEDGYAEVTILNDSETISYSWSNDSNSSSVSSLGAGTHDVLIYDEFNCPLSLQFEIGSPEAISAEANITDESSFQAQDGSISVEANGGTAPYSYEWDNGATGNSLENLSPGTYTVSIIDDNGCIQIEALTVENSEVDCSTVALDFESVNLDCNGDNNGSISTSINGTYGEIEINWNTLATSSSLENLGAGTYTISIVDEAGCSVSEEITIEEPSEIQINLVASNGNCATTPEISAWVNGGTAPYSYEWSNGMTTETISDLEAGMYTVSITDNNGCEQVDAVEIEPSAPPMLIETASENPSCVDDANGSINVNTMGGTPPYDYSWQHDENINSPELNNLSAGDYTVVITDSEGCQFVTTINIDTPNAITVTSNITSSTQGVDATITALGGTPPYQYNWNDGHIGVFYPNIIPGEYLVTVTDSNGCQQIETVVVNLTSITELDGLESLNIFPNPVSDILNINAVFTQKENIQISLLDVLGQVHQIQNFDSAAINTSINTNELAPGTYLVKIQGEKGFVVKKVVVVR